MSDHLEDISTYLDAEGVGVCGEDIFIGFLPDGNEKKMAVLDTGGLAIDDDIRVRYPTFQIFIRAKTWKEGNTWMNQVRNTLHRVTNMTLVDDSVYFYYILATNDGGHLGKDEVRKHTFSINFQCAIRDYE